MSTKNKIFLIITIILLGFSGAWWFMQTEEPIQSPPSLNNRINEEVMISPSPTFVVSNIEESKDLEEVENEPSSLSKLIQSFVPTAEPTSIPVDLPPLPQQKILSGGSHTFQTFNNCGPASLSMLLSHYGITETQQVLGQQLRPHQNSSGDNDDKSVTLDEISAKAQEYGFLVYHRPAGNMEIMKAFIAQDMPVLTRTWVSPNEDIGHFRVVRGYDETTQELIQDDSLQGKGLRYTYDEFDKIWGPFNSEFLVLVPREKQAIAEAILDEILDPQAAWQKSLAMANQRIAQNPGDFYAVFNRSAALYQLGDHSAAIEAYESIASRLPSRMLWYQIEPILSYWKAGRSAETLRLIEQVLNNQNRAFSELYFIRGSIYQSQGNDDLANESFSLAESYNPTGSWRVNVE
jgi:hypothetical protein